MKPIHSLILALSISRAFAEVPDVVATSAPKIPNTVVLNLEGKRIKFYDALIKEKVVAINFVFTSCPTICPLIQVQFSQLQKDLKAAGVKNIQFISVTVDPVTDTPERLSAWSKKITPDMTWNYVTGEKATIDDILKKLEVFTADIDDHPSFILIGNDAKGEWKRVNSLAPVKTLAKELTALAGK
jgi:cytochrome oxidase Cu insertion factor (SCO1/SenC/PrrC family)